MLQLAKFQFQIDHAVIVKFHVQVNHAAASCKFHVQVDHAVDSKVSCSS